MPDLSSVAREAAEREWTRSSRAGDAELYIDGFTECASRIPSEEEIAAVLRRHNFDELLLGNIEWDGYTAVCACGWSSEEYKMPGEAHEAHSAHAADAVLAQITDLLSTPDKSPK